MHKFVNYARSHTFHFATALLLVVSVVSQCVIVYGMNKTNTELKAKVSELNTELEIQESDMSTRMASLNSKFDILDSTVKPDEKRRQHIKLVRDAITSSTNNPPDIRTLNRIAIAIVDHSYTYNLSIAKVLAQMKQESNFNPLAESRAGAKGLMQVIDDTAAEIADDLGRKRYNIWDISTNVEFGCYYMAKMLDHYKHDYVYSLRAYNFGPHNVDKVIAGEADYSIIREVIENDKTVQYLVDRRGRFLQDDNQQRIIIVGEVPEELRYPLETQRYIKHIVQFRRDFSEMGLDRIE
jgi:transglycosylase-like protein with SLT domain